jgi:hypothetical protein
VTVLRALPPKEDPAVSGLPQAEQNRAVSGQNSAHPPHATIVASLRGLFGAVESITLARTDHNFITVPPEGGIDIAVHARNKTLAEVVATLAAGIGTHAATPEDCSRGWRRDRVGA